MSHWNLNINPIRIVVQLPVIVQLIGIKEEVYFEPSQIELRIRTPFPILATRVSKVTIQSLEQTSFHCSLAEARFTTTQTK